MKIKKNELFEIIDSNGDLIGSDDIPKTGADLETQANNTTDYNVQIGTQPFRYDMLGRFGFTLLPFMEGKEYNGGQQEFIDDLAELLNQNRVELVKYYFKNPNKLKPDYRKSTEKDFEWFNKDECYGVAKKIADLVQKHFENAFKEPKQIDESSVVEDKVVDKRGEDEISKKSEDGGVKEKQLEKIAGLINNKFNKKDIDNLINLLERRNG